jgi:hypothetical protein
MIGMTYSMCRHQSPLPPQMAASAWPECSSIAATTVWRLRMRRSAASGGTPRRPTITW